MPEFPVGDPEFVVDDDGFRAGVVSACGANAGEPARGTTEPDNSENKHTSVSNIEKINQFGQNKAFVWSTPYSYVMITDYTTTK